jgi:hypothetical protein
MTTGGGTKPFGDRESDIEGDIGAASALRKGGDGDPCAPARDAGADADAAAEASSF